ncbi:hypothetical protein PG991_013829 [Apiospora marii]|uniref:Uncharacterized protein n=1 Tax=Apiospora marii TaxID=335849 RepID=A0ABR1R7X7_9PEZI
METKLWEREEHRQRLEEDRRQQAERIRAMERELAETRRENERLREAHAIIHGIHTGLLSQCDPEPMQREKGQVDSGSELPRGVVVGKAQRGLLYRLESLEQGLPDLPNYLDDPEVRQRMVD